MEIIMLLDWAKANAPEMIIPLLVVALLGKAVLVLSKNLPDIIRICLDIKELHTKTLRELTDLRENHNKLSDAVVTLRNDHRILTMRVTGIEERCVCEKQASN